MFNPSDKDSFQPFTSESSGVSGGGSAGSLSDTPSSTSESGEWDGGTPSSTSESGGEDRGTPSSNIIHSNEDLIDGYEVKPNVLFKIKQGLTIVQDKLSEVQCRLATIFNHALSKNEKLQHIYSKVSKRWATVNKTKLLTWALLCVLIVTLVNAQVTRSIEKGKSVKAKEVVMIMYDFMNLEQVEANQRKLKQFVTDEVFNELTFDSEERRLNTYLKFAAESSSIKFLEEGPDYLIYTIDCAALTPGRKFIFRYHMNNKGKISDIYEAELLDFM